MFDLLKKKFSSFIGSITKKEKEESNSGEETGINQAEEQHSKTAIEIVNRGTGENQHHNKIEEDRKIVISKADEEKRENSSGHKDAAKEPQHAGIGQKETKKENEGVVHIHKNAPDLHEDKNLGVSRGEERATAHPNELRQEGDVKAYSQKPIEDERKVERAQKVAEKANDQTGGFAKSEKRGILEKIFERKPKESDVKTRKELGTDVNDIGNQQIVQTKEKQHDVHHSISLETKIKGFVFGTVEIKEKDVKDILEEFKMALLESDVSYEVAERMVDTMQKKLVGSKVDSQNIEIEIRKIIRDSVSEVLSSNSNIDLVKMANSKKEQGNGPFVILFIGPNGAGKTTTMGKLASMMLKNGLTCVLSASDTFRAAAIEQTAIHAQRLGINVVKGTYGADPASIAFDAIAYAKARNIDVVLVDSAGRQETNKNLVEEMKKMVRVAKPDVKIFIGESIAGNALIEQVKTFDAAIKLDGIILTKLDVDAKGGNTISILSETTIPVLFFGVGEAYDSLMPYDQKVVLDNIVPI